MAPGLTTRPPLRRGALPHELAEIRRRANAGWGDRPTWSARIEGRPRPFGQDECRGKLPGACHSAAVRGVSLETGATKLPFGERREPAFHEVDPRPDNGKVSLGCDFQNLIAA